MSKRLVEEEQRILTSVPSAQSKPRRERKRNIKQGTKRNKI